jgi:hypothetical protein
MLLKSTLLFSGMAVAQFEVLCKLSFKKAGKAPPLWEVLSLFDPIFFPA